MISYSIDADSLKYYVALCSNCYKIDKKSQPQGFYLVPQEQSLAKIPKTVEHLFLIDYKLKVDAIEFSSDGFPHLQSLSIAYKCLKSTRTFVLNGLEKLESVTILENNFSLSKSNEREDGLCRIVNCPNLRKLVIGKGCFCNFKTFELSNVNSLQSIYFGYTCFSYADCILKGEDEEC